MLIHHITLMNGHNAVHRLDTLSAGAVAACRALQPAGGPVPGFSAFRVEVHAPVFTIYRGKVPGLLNQTKSDIGWLADFERCMAAAILLPA